MGSGDGIEKYYGLWGIPAEVVAEFTKDPYVEVWGLNQESGFSVHAMRKTAGPNGETTTSKHEWTWHAPIERLSPVPVSKMVASASLVGPNTIQIIYMTQPGSGLEVTMTRPTNSQLPVLRKPTPQPRPTVGWVSLLCSPVSMRGSARTGCLFLFNLSDSSICPNGPSSELPIILWAES